MDKEKQQRKSQNISRAPFDISETWAYKAFVKTAFKLVEKPKKLLDLGSNAINFLYKDMRSSAFLHETKTQIFALGRLVRAYAKGEYQALSVGNVIMMVAALLYLLSPIDFIPDFLIGGFVDDIALIMWVFKKTKEEIDFFLDWEDSQKIRINLDELKNEEKAN